MQWLFAIDQPDLRNSGFWLAAETFGSFPEESRDLVNLPPLGLWHHDGHVDDEEELDNDEHHEHPGAHQ